MTSFFPSTQSTSKEFLNSIMAGDNSPALHSTIAKYNIRYSFKLTIEVSVIGETDLKQSFNTLTSMIQKRIKSNISVNPPFPQTSPLKVSMTEVSEFDRRVIVAFEWTHSFDGIFEELFIKTNQMKRFLDFGSNRINSLMSAIELESIGRILRNPLMIQDKSAITLLERQITGKPEIEKTFDEKEKIVLTDEEKQIILERRRKIQKEKQPVEQQKKKDPEPPKFKTPKKKKSLFARTFEKITGIFRGFGRK